MMNKQLIKEHFWQISSDIFYFTPYIKVLKTRLYRKTNVYI